MPPKFRPKRFNYLITNLFLIVLIVVFSIVSCQNFHPQENVVTQPFNPYTFATGPYETAAYFQNSKGFRTSRPKNPFEFLSQRGKFIYDKKMLHVIFPLRIKCYQTNATIVIDKEKISLMADLKLVYQVSSDRGTWRTILNSSQFVNMAKVRNYQIGKQSKNAFVPLNETIKYTFLAEGSTSRLEKGKRYKHQLKYVKTCTGMRETDSVDETKEKELVMGPDTVPPKPVKFELVSDELSSELNLVQSDMPAFTTITKEETSIQNNKNPSNLESVPEVHPQNVSFQFLDKNSGFRVIWSPVTPDQQKAPNFYYLVSWRLMKSPTTDPSANGFDFKNDWKSKRIYKWEQSSIVISLQPTSVNATYEFKVESFNYKGKAKGSSAIYRITVEPHEQETTSIASEKEGKKISTTNSPATTGFENEQIISLPVTDSLITTRSPRAQLDNDNSDRRNLTKPNFEILSTVMNKKISPTNTITNTENTKLNTFDDLEAEINHVDNISDSIDLNNDQIDDEKMKIFLASTTQFWNLTESENLTNIGVISSLNISENVDTTIEANEVVYLDQSKNTTIAAERYSEPQLLIKSAYEKEEYYSSLALDFKSELEKKGVKLEGEDPFYAAVVKLKKNNTRAQSLYFEIPSFSALYVSQNIKVNLSEEAMTNAEMQSADYVELKYASYQKKEAFKPQDNTKEEQIISLRRFQYLDFAVVEIYVESAKIKNLKKPIEISFPVNDNIKNIEIHLTDRKRPKFNKIFHCAYWDSKQEKWSVEGVKTAFKWRDSEITCESTHLTAFSILISPTYSVNDVILSRISYAGCIISSFGLVATIFTYSIFRNLRRDYFGRIIINLCVSLLALNVMFLLSSQIDYWTIGETAVDAISFLVEDSMFEFSEITLCLFFSTFLHYLTLTSLCWMAMEAALLYQLLVIVFPSRESHYLLRRAVLAWGVPLVWVLISVIFKKTNVNDSCLLPRDNSYIYYIFNFFPAVILIFVNLIIFFRVAHILLTTRKGNTKEYDRLSQIRGVFSIMTLLGITWIFGILTYGQMGNFFEYLFCICNSLQGIMIFITRCAMYAEVRACWIKAFKSISCWPFATKDPWNNQNVGVVKTRWNFSSKTVEFCQPESERCLARSNTDSGRQTTSSDVLTTSRKATN